MTDPYGSQGQCFCRKRRRGRDLIQLGRQGDQRGVNSSNKVKQQKRKRRMASRRCWQSRAARRVRLWYAYAVAVLPP